MPVSDEDELRARIEAQIVSRRADAAPPKRERVGRKGKQDAAGDADLVEAAEVAPAVPRSLEPIRPWLVGDSVHLDFGPGPDASAPTESRVAPPDSAADTDHAVSSRTLEPARPWLRPSAEPDGGSSAAGTDLADLADLPAASDAAPSPPADPDSGTSRKLQPVRPWLHRRTESEPVPIEDDAVPGAKRIPARGGRPEPRLLLPGPARTDTGDPDDEAPDPDLAAADAADSPAEPRKLWRRRGAEPVAADDDDITTADWLAPGPPIGPSQQAAPEPGSRPQPAPSAAGDARADPPPPGSDLARRLAAAGALPPAYDPVADDVDEDDDDHPGPIRRALSWLLEPAVGHEDRPSDGGETASAEATTRTLPPLRDARLETGREPQEALPPWPGDTDPVQPKVEGAVAAAEPVAVAEPLPDDQADESPEVAAATAGERDPVPPSIAPGTDLARRLAAANAAAAARARSAPPDEAIADDDYDDEDEPRRGRRIPAFAPTGSGPRSADLDRDRGRAGEHPEYSPLVTGTAFATKTAPPTSSGAAQAAQPDAPKRRLRAVKAAAVVIVIVGAAALLLRAFVVAPYYIPSGSMEPTLHGCKGCNDDHVLVDKLSYRMHDIRRGDVVVFHRPKAWKVSDKVLIKRVIGLPGDVLTVRKGTVYVDGLALEEPYLNPACHGVTTNFPRKPVTVADGQAFVMGDNRCDSSDSRRFGPISDSSVIGRAFVTIWPLGRVHWL